MYELRILEKDNVFSLHMVYVDSAGNPLYYINEPFVMTAETYEELKDNTLMCSACFTKPTIDANTISTHDQYINSTNQAIELFR